MAVSPKQLEALGWKRLNPGAASNHAAWGHAASGWWIEHCGHPTANFPLQLFNPFGTFIKAPNGRAFQDLPAAIGHHAQLLRGVQDPLPIDNIDDLLAERTHAEVAAIVADYNAIFKKPIADISQEAGRIERESPLFFGKGANPTLF
jgi:hypothetical protein